MKLIRIMDYNNPHEPLGQEPTRSFARVRRAARAVVRDQAGGVYLMHAASHGYHKLPGGGVDAGEDLEMALHREIQEEMGARIIVLKEVGQTIQFDEVEDFRQDSYCYLARLEGELGEPALTQSEAEAGFRVERFATMAEAIAVVTRSSHQAKYASMAIRDAALLAAAAALSYH